jgi:L-iditol 2-dehydrogenase
MIQAFVGRPGKIIFRDVPLPDILPHQVLVRMKRIGISSSDMNVFKGRHPRISYPVVPGQEASASVEKVGSGVTSLVPGDKVTVQPQMACGKCYPCRHGMSHACVEWESLGIQTSGMASEFFATDVDRLLKLPHGMTYDQGALIGPLGMAVHAIRRYGSICGRKVLVLGGGSFGNLVAQAAKGMGAAAVLLCESEGRRLEIARACGIDTVDPHREDLSARIRQAFGPERADVVFECVGTNAAMKQAIEFSRMGSDIVMVGVFDDLGTINFGQVNDHELRLIGTSMYSSGDCELAVDLVNAGHVRLDAIIAHQVVFSELSRAYGILGEEGVKGMKVLISFDE